ncbi:hypothetical protein LG651_04645 [Tamlana sp. 62-3]|uniref:DUF5017 domain-containing protein n=1 Tax=Neotamlana sargassicola TaxID=2883125 RepID=A0A9X1L6F6_9FLAO|nr:hypothetical protein [Tamlana sargassicola]MCB4807529.1 hypothetical protein [Tamlana sargassicola]
MKKIVYLFSLVAATVFVGCNPLEDVHQELADQDNLENKIVDTGIEYTLTDEDYEELELDYSSFNSADQANSLIPVLLSSKYPYLDAGSQAYVTYNWYRGYPSNSYELDGDDYSNPDYTGFPEGEDDAVVLSTVTAAVGASFTSPSEGDVVFATYNFYTVADADSYYEADLRVEADYNTYEAINVSGDQEWYYQTYGATMNGYSGGTDYANEDWLISAEIDLTDVTDPGLTVTQILNYLDGDILSEVLVSKDYTTGGDHTAATWEALTLAPLPTGSSWDAVANNEYDLSAYAGETIHLAFKYDYEAGDTPTWEITEVLIKPFGIDTETIYEESGMFLTYNGTAWESATNATYIVDAEDYDAMGEASGQPGSYNNFSSSISSDDYIPTYLGLKFPYVTEEDATMFVGYLYYSSSAGAVQFRSDAFTYANGSWAPYETEIAVTAQYGVNSDTEWEPDNTIAYTLTTADYSFIAASDALAAEYPDAVGNLDSYGNFNRQGGGTTWTDEALLKAFNLLLDELNPSAEEGQKYALSFAVYNGASGVETFFLIKEGGAWVVNNQ